MWNDMRENKTLFKVNSMPFMEKNQKNTWKFAQAVEVIFLSHGYSATNTKQWTFLVFEFPRTKFELWTIKCL